MSDRKRCYECQRPEAHCLCPFVQEIGHRTEILILQDPRERRHAFNTARLAERSLRKGKMIVGRGHELAADPNLDAELEGAGLLYPAPGAKDLSQIAPEDQPKKLVVLDGTWSQARAMYRMVKSLRKLPHYTLPSGQVSGFKIRKQPKDFCLSTLEAIHSALHCIEPDTPELDTLLRPFDAMQTQHIHAVDSPAPRRRKPRPDRLKDRLPPAIGPEFDRLVVIYGEMSPVTVPGEARRLLTFAAARPASGETMRVVLENSAEDAETWEFFRIDAGEARDARPLDEVRARWNAFRRDGDIVAAWSPSTMHVVRRELGDLGETLLLKGAYMNLRPQRGCLEQLVVREGLVSAETMAHRETKLSRTEERLLNVIDIAHLLHGISEDVRARMAEPPVKTDGPKRHAEALREQHFCRVDAAAMHAALQDAGGTSDWQAFASSWSKLPPDGFMADGGRYRQRRHAVFTVQGSPSTGASEDAAPAAKPPQPHYQSRDRNPLNGGIQRWFEPIDPSVLRGPTVQSVFTFCRGLLAELRPEVPSWHVELHQFRILAAEGEAGQPTPEGMHRDGVDFVLVLLVRRQNVSSGTTTIADLDREPMGEFTLADPFDAALVDDRYAFHGVTPIEPVQTNKPAYRDVLVVTWKAEGPPPGAGRQ